MADDVTRHSSHRLSSLFIEVFEAHTGKNFFSVAAFAGISYHEIFRQCTGTALSTPKGIEAQMAQMKLVSTILRVDRSEPLLDALLANDVLARMMHIMRNTWDIYLDTLPQASADSDVWHNRMIVALLVVIDMERSLGTSSKVALEIIQANFLYILERWSISANDECLSNTIPVPCESFRYSPVFTEFVLEYLWRLTETADLSSDGALTGQYYAQLAYICRRVRSRPGIRQAVIDVWHRDYSSMHLIIKNPARLCGAPGCKSVENAPFLCPGCESVFYCNEVCQKS